MLAIYGKLVGGGEGAGIERLEAWKLGPHSRGAPQGGRRIKKSLVCDLKPDKEIAPLPAERFFRETKAVRLASQETKAPFRGRPGEQCEFHLASEYIASFWLSATWTTPSLV